MENDAFSAFSSCDQDGDGFITQAEMHYWLSGSLQALGQTDLEADVHAQEAVLSAFQHVDRNQDQLLSFNEFKNWFGSSQRSGFNPAAAPPLHPYPGSNRGGGSINGAMISGNQSDAGTSGGVVNRHRRTAMASGFEVRVPSATSCVWITDDPPHNAMIMHQAPSAPRAQALNYLDASILKHSTRKKRSTFVAYEIEVTPTGGGSSWSVLKRYSSIATFVTNAKTQLQASSGRAPMKSLWQKDPVADAHFPPKIMGKVNVEKRRLQLEWFLRVFLREPRMQHLPITQSFFQTTDAEMPGASGPQEPFNPAPGAFDANHHGPFPLPPLSSTSFSFSPSLPSPPPSSLSFAQPNSGFNHFGGGDSGRGLRSNTTALSELPSSPVVHNKWMTSSSSSSSSSSSVYHESKGVNQQSVNLPPLHSPSTMLPPPSQPLPSQSGPSSSSEHDQQTPPAEMLASLGLSLPAPLPNCLYRLPPPQLSSSIQNNGMQHSSNMVRSLSCTVQVTVPLSAVTRQRDKPTKSSSSSSGGGADWSAERELGLQVLAQLQLASRRNLSNVTVLSVSASSSHSFSTSQNTRGNGATVPVGFLHATKALLREVLGSRGRAICDGRTESELLAFFRQADTDGDGVLSVREMQTVLQALNLPCDPQMVEATLAVADLDGNGTLDYAEFVTFVCQARGVGGNGNGNGEEDQLLETFGLFDKDGDGKLGPADLMTALSDQGQTVSFDEVERIIAKATQGSGQPYLLFPDFQFLMRHNNFTQKSGGPQPGGAHPSAGSGASTNANGPAVVVVAHLSIDDTQAAAETLLERLSRPSGLRLRKLGREVSSNASSSSSNSSGHQPQKGGQGKTKVIGGGMRTFRVHKHTPWLLTWRKGGLKSRLTGNLDLRLVTDVITGGISNTTSSSGSSTRGNAGYGNNGYGSEYGNSYGNGYGDGSSDYGANYGPAYGYGLGGGSGSSAQGAPHSSSSSSVLGGNPQLHLFLISPVGCLGIAANNAEDHRMLLDGFRRLRLKVRYHATAALHSSSGMSGPLALAAAESSLVDAFGACDANGSGQLDRATLGRVLWAQGYRIPEDDLQSLVGSSSEPTLDYRDFAANVVALTDPETHAKEAAEQSFLDLLLPLDYSGRGLVSASEIVRVWQSAGHGIIRGEGSSSGAAAAQDILDFALSAAAVPSSDHSMSHGGGPSFMAGSYGQDYHQNDSIHHNGNRSPMDDRLEAEFIDVRMFARVASGLDTRAALAFEQWQVEKRKASAAAVTTAYLEKRTVFAVEMLERYNDPTGGPPGAISQANLGLTLSDLNLRMNDALNAVIAKAPVHKGRGSLSGTLKWRHTSIHQVLGALIVESDEHIWLRAFDRWDRNRDGHLSIHEVEKALAAGVATDGISGGAGEDMVNGGGVGNEVQQRTRAEVESLVRAADINLDGKISREEFLAVMKLSELNE